MEHSAWIAKYLGYLIIIRKKFSAVYTVSRKKAVPYVKYGNTHNTEHKSLKNSGEHTDIHLNIVC